MNPDRNNSKNNQEWLWVYSIFLGIAILGIIAYLSLHRFSSLGITPSVGLSNDSDLARVMYETGTIIVCLATLILAVMAFIVPFTIYIWSEMSDSYFELFIQIFREKNINPEIKNSIIQRIMRVINDFERIQQQVRTILKILVYISTAAMILLGLLAGGTIFCWNIVQYLWLRALLFIICLIIAFGLFFLLTRFMAIRPEIKKRELQVEIINELSKLAEQTSAPAGQQKVRKNKKNVEKEK